MSTEPLKRLIGIYGILLRKCTTGRGCILPLAIDLQSSSKWGLL
jgi:hypothetical protein